MTMFRRQLIRRSNVKQSKIFHVKHTSKSSQHMSLGDGTINRSSESGQARAASVPKRKTVQWATEQKPTASDAVKQR